MSFNPLLNPVCANDYESVTFSLFRCGRMDTSVAPSYDHMGLSHKVRLPVYYVPFN